MNLPERAIRQLEVTMATPITRKQKELLDFLKVYHKKWGFAPTYVEMSKAFGISLQSIWERLHNLESAGRIRIYRFKSRGIEILL